jgi:hypothetical protein
MTFQTVEVTDVFLVQDAAQCYFDSVNFIGPLTAQDIISNTSADDIAGVRFASTTSYICNQITFDKCKFFGLTYGINTDQQTQSVTVSNSKFDTLYQGIVLGAGTPVNGGPTGFRATYNMFDNVYTEGIVYDAVSLNVSAYNIFYDVGNEFTSSPVTSIILFGNDNNVSIADMFERNDTDAATEARVSVTGAAGTTGTQLQIGRYARENGRSATLADNQATTSIFTTNTDTIKAFQMTYTIIRDTATRFGVLTVATNSSAVFNSNDSYTENISTGITLTVSQVGQVVSVNYSSTSTGLSGTLTYSLAHLA